MTEKPKRTTFRIRLEEMVVTLRNDIAMGRYGPGDFLPSEFQLIEQFRLSKNSVRKGLDKLVEQGLIEKVPRVGTRVIQSEARSPVTIRLGYHSTMIEQVNLYALLDLFHRAHPDIIVQPVPLPQLRLTAEWNDFMRTEPVDVLTVNNQLYEKIAEIGPVSDVLEPVEKAEGTYSFLFRSFTEEGTLYAQPFVFSPLVLCYNKSHFRQSGLPEPNGSWTWDDVAEASGPLSGKQGSLGFYIHYLSLNRWPLFLLQNRLRFERGEDGRLSFDHTRFGAATTIGAALLAKSGAMSAYLSERDDDAERLFIQQKISMLVTSYFSLNSLRGTDLEYDIAPLPHSEQAATLLLPIGLGINKHGKQKHAAKTFVDYCLGDEAQLHVRQTTLTVPARKRAAEWVGEDRLNRPSRYFLYRDIVPTFRLYSDMNISYGELERMCEELKLYWAGLEDMETVCRRIGDNV
ncbi:MAG: extracellular solute-binding protein [Paenibacillus sp.]|jgi:multiple sugar transport system substrate-binding protein|nr:extracellular solute-binding protein [Paenibacillus sp.]